jgi:hypothetical protein
LNAEYGNSTLSQNEPAAKTLQEDAEGWGRHQAPKYEQIPEDEDRHVPELRDTKGEEIPRWVVLRVMEAQKEDKAVGYDGVPITMWNGET